MICDGLDNRLCSVAELVRQGAVFADIGTDHAYLPIFLLKRGRIDRAFCSDINQGPLDSARANAADNGVADMITFTLADGAEALSNFPITDYAVCGMGGELIADIIDRAPHLGAEGVNLILQPMTKQGHLRSYLASHGFKILTESYSEDSGKCYAVFLATYTGECRVIDECEAELPAPDCEIIGVGAFIAYLNMKIGAYRRAAAGKMAGGEREPRELCIISKMEDRIESLRSVLNA